MSHNRPAPLRVVQAWQDAVNTKNVKRLQALSAPDIEIVGPRGSGFGRQLLTEWLGRVSLRLTAVRAFGRSAVVVLEQRGVWRAPDTDTVTGDKTLASVFHINQQGQIAKFARYEQLDDALADVGLTRSDEIH